MQKGITKLYRFSCGYDSTPKCHGVIFIRRGAQQWAIIEARNNGWGVRKPYGWVCPECKNHLDNLRKRGQHG